jgi:long-chain alkane monooxygenase
VERVRSIKEQAKAAGRDPADMRFIIMATVIVAPTEAEARDKHRELARYVDVEGMLALYSGLSGFDFSQNTLEAAKLAEARGVTTVIEGFTTANTVNIPHLAANSAYHNALGSRVLLP